jgi:hypothetical protein
MKRLGHKLLLLQSDADALLHLSILHWPGERRVQRECSDDICISAAGKESSKTKQISSPTSRSETCARRARTLNVCRLSTATRSYFQSVQLRRNLFTRHNNHFLQTTLGVGTADKTCIAEITQKPAHDTTRCRPSCVRFTQNVSSASLALKPVLLLLHHRLYSSITLCVVTHATSSSQPAASHFCHLLSGYFSNSDLAGCAQMTRYSSNLSPSRLSDQDLCTFNHLQVSLSTSASIPIQKAVRRSVGVLSAVTQ